jgi:hypothetical protein
VAVFEEGAQACGFEWRGVGVGDGEGVVRHFSPICRTCQMAVACWFL